MQVVNECIHVWTADRMLRKNVCIRRTRTILNGFVVSKLNFYIPHTRCLLLNQEWCSMHGENHFITLNAIQHYSKFSTYKVLEISSSAIPNRDTCEQMHYNKLQVTSTDGYKITRI